MFCDIAGFNQTLEILVAIVDKHEVLRKESNLAQSNMAAIDKELTSLSKTQSYSVAEAESHHKKMQVIK